MPIPDVHAPHGTVHTWKDFAIHIATISVGLLIAVGLEQTIELFHHRHERLQLEEDLQKEGVLNRGIVDRDVAYLDLVSAWIVNANQVVRVAKTAHGQSPMLYPDRHMKEALRRHLLYFSPTLAVWNTAKERGAIALLPQDEAQTYTRLYRICDVILALDLEMRRASLARVGAQNQFSSTPGSPPDLTAMSSADFDRLSSVLMQEYANIAAVKSILIQYRAANEAVLSGLRSEDGIAESIHRELSRIAGSAVSDTPSSPEAVPK